MISLMNAANPLSLIKNTQSSIHEEEERHRWQKVGMNNIILFHSISRNRMGSIIAEYWKKETGIEGHELLSRNTPPIK